jgi:hypothetical protein
LSDPDFWVGKIEMMAVIKSRTEKEVVGQK